MNRKKKFVLNTGLSFLNQLVVLICGFVLPRQLLLYFGSELNGLVSSITRFLSMIALLESGIGPVVQACLYKPLADKNKDELSVIVSAAEKFYRRIAYIFLAYIAVLAVVYPLIKTEYDWAFTATLVLIISISTFMQYYFGIAYRAVLSADQKVYFNSILNILATIANTVICVVLMHLGSPIHIVKLASSLVFIINPLIQYGYVKKHYEINTKIVYSGEPIKQKWNGLIQHLAGVVNAETDVFLLTFLGSLSSVSIYTVYLQVITGVENIIMTASNGIDSLWGNMYAKKEINLLNKTFDAVEFAIHASVTALFSTTAVLIVPFVLVYTRGINDANYAVPIFGMILTFAYGAICLRVPYFRIIKVAGHFKETQIGSIIAMILNIVFSLALVRRYQLNGVAVGTLVAMLFHTCYLANYIRTRILNRPIWLFIKHMIVDLATGSLGIFLTCSFTLGAQTYGSWILLGFKVAIIIFPLVFLVNVIVYREDAKTLIGYFKRRRA